MSSSNSTEAASDEHNLDSLLDDALQDFSKPIPPKKCEEISTVDDSTENTNAWTDEFIAAATQNFEVTMKTILNQQKAQTEETEEEKTSDNSLDMGAMSSEFAKFAEAAAKAATDASSDENFTQCLAYTMQEMAKNKEEAQITPSAEDLAKMFDGFGLGDSGVGDGSELGSLFPLMQTMLENILSKDILYPPLKDIVTKYPDWLADNRSILSEEEFDRYNKQYDIMKQVVEEFEKASDSDSNELKAQTSESVLLLMQKLQELGQPPRDLMGDYEPLFLNTDDQGTSQLPDLSALLGAVGFPSFGTSEIKNPGEDTTESGTSIHSQSATQENPDPPLPNDDQCSMM